MSLEWFVDKIKISKKIRICQEQVKVLAKMRDLMMWGGKEGNKILLPLLNCDKPLDAYETYLNLDDIYPSPEMANAYLEELKRTGIQKKALKNVVKKYPEYLS